MKNARFPLGQLSVETGENGSTPSTGAFRHGAVHSRLNSTSNGIVGTMSGTIRRRARGTGLDTVTLKVDVAPEAKALVERVRVHMGLSQAQAAELILLRVQVDHRGLPLWHDIDAYQEGALPIAKAS